MPENARHLLELRNLLGGHSSYGTAEILVLETDEARLQAGKSVQDKLVDINLTTIYEFP